MRLKKGLMCCVTLWLLSCVVLSLGCVFRHGNGDAEKGYIAIPVSAHFIYKLAWYTDEIDGLRYASNPNSHIKDRLARIGVDTNGIVDVVYRAQAGVLGIRGERIPKRAIVNAIKRTEAEVSTALLDAYYVQTEGPALEGQFPWGKRSADLEYDEATGRFLGILRRRKDR